jgi:hypothetical protein
MPPKKKPSDNDEATESESDPIAEATNSLLGDRSNTSSGERENTQSRNSTISQTRDRTSMPTGTEQDSKDREGGAIPELRNRSGEETQDSGANDGNETEKDRLPGPYVPADVSYALQEVQLKLRRLTGEKVSQSLIIQCALEICIEDFRRQGAESALAALVDERSS